ncbi:hypothetical protein SCA6_000196 [Theobroma cacao]
MSKRERVGSCRDRQSCILNIAIFSSPLFRLCQELAPSGRMVLMFNGRQTADPANKDSCYKWDLLPCRGLILPGFTVNNGSFNIPYYNPSQEEVEYLVGKEGSLTTEFIDTIALGIGCQNGWSSLESRIKGHRCFSEPILSHQFGRR